MIKLYQASKRFAWVQRFVPRSAVGLSRQTRRIIRQNLWVSLGMVAFLVPATLLGLRIGAAVLFHEGSTLLVVFNALRLLAYQDPQTKARES